MAYTNFQNCTKQEYDSIIYSQEDINRCKLYFNNVELQDADNYLEKITFTKRVLPENGKKVFSLDNFIAEEVEIIIHDIDPTIIQDKVRIELGTLVDEQNDIYEFIPMGVFNIQDTPTRNDDKITIKLRDNACLFDFNYNAKPLIDSLGGNATKMQILQDICSQANVVCGVSSFLGDSDLIGIYDNSIKGRMYVAYLAEQAGCIAKIDRTGSLIFIPLNSLTTQKIPLNLIGKYIKGNSYTIERVVYELGTIKFETSNDETLQTLYISSLNPYISTQQQIENIFNNILNGFETDSIEISDNIIGNPTIDGYDLIQVYGYYDEYDNFIDDDTVIVFTTLANNTLYYNGGFRTKYKTEIGLEERTENTTNTGEAIFQKRISSEVDRLNGVITTEVENNILNPNNPESVVSQMSVIKQDYTTIKAEISDIADITTSAEDTDAQVELENINVSEPITLKIHPTSESISYLYPNSVLYPSPTTYLKNRKIRFYNTSDGEIICDYELPEDLLYYDNENYDEFLLDYGDGTSETRICQVTKKCKYNADGTVGLLSTPETHDYSSIYPTIDLTNGDYTISILGYSTGYIFARLMASNIYTTQFSTKVETNALIEAKAGEINLEVNQKLDLSDFNSANIILKINNDGTSSASINADKININGIITAINNNTSTTINGNKITTGTITADQISSNAITTTKLASNSITADKIKAGEITTDKIASGAVTANKVSSDIITTTNFSAQTINADQITTGTLTGVNINLQGNDEDDKTKLNVKYTNSTEKVDIQGFVAPSNIGITNSYSPYIDGHLVPSITRTSYTHLVNIGYQVGLFNNSTANDGSQYGNCVVAVTGGSPEIGFATWDSNDNMLCDGSWRSYGNTIEMILSNPNNTTEVNADYVRTPIVYQTSLAEKKKNIKLYKNSALDLIKNSDIYTYNLKHEEDDNRKHIGLVIGKKYKCCKEVMSNDNQSIDQYSMISVSWKAIQELLNKIEKMEEQLCK